MALIIETQELVQLVETVFRPEQDDRSVAFLVDLPDERVPDHVRWGDRRDMVASWQRQLAATRLFSKVDLYCYPNVHGNNADLPRRAWAQGPGPVPDHVHALDGEGVLFESVFESYRILLAVTELSATAPLKLEARRHGFRAATMPGFSAEMIPALRLDYEEIHRRCLELKRLLDAARAAHFRFEAEGKVSSLTLDLRHRRAAASGGLVREPGTAGNLPSGETYIVPYEGELDDDPSRSRGTLPLQLDDELMHYRIEGNRVREVVGTGRRAEEERRSFRAEPAYANVAELGLGVLQDFGLQPIGELLLDEKLGLHIAFGRSDHFGGQVGAGDFRSPDRVVHIDRVYLPAIQPRVQVLAVDLESGDSGDRVPLMRNGRYVLREES